MEYYGNNDWRDYIRRQNELKHFGIPKRSGRYPWGSGEDPYHHGADAPGVARKKRLHNFTNQDKYRVKRAFKREGVIGGLYEMSTIKREAKEQPEYKADAEKKIKFYADYLNKYLWNNEKALKKATRLAAELEAREIADTEGRNYNKVLEKTLKEFQNTSDDRVRGKIESAYDEMDSYARNTGFEAFRALNRYESTQDTLSKMDSVAEWHKDLKKQIYESRSGNKLSDGATDESKRFNQDLSNRLSEAKNNDRYDLGFLEAIQNKGLMDDDKESERLKAYKEYLEDPEDFWKNKRHKYPDE